MRGHYSKHVRLFVAVVATALVAAGVAFRPVGDAPRPSSHAATPLAAVGVAGSSSSQASPESSSGRSRPHRTPPLRSIVPSRPVWLGNKVVEREQGRPLPPSVGREAGVDDALQSVPGNVGQMPAPITNFEGVGNVNGVLPPDTNGDVGPNHYMQWVNLSFAIYNKLGGLVYGPAAGNTLFPTRPVCGNTNHGDPVVLYDQLAGRWVVSQFSVSGPYYQCIAVSQTNDPTAGWCTYEFLVHATKMNDYPKMGVWPSQNAFVMTANQFLGGASWSGAGIFAFERDRMLACQSARFVYRDMQPVDPNMGGMLPADVDGRTAPPAGAPAPIVVFDDNAWGYPQDQLRVWNGTVNWGATPSLTVSLGATLPTAAFDSGLCNTYGNSCVPQPGTTQRLDTLSDRLMNRLAYRNFGDHEALVVNHSVDVGSNRAGIRWYELSKTTGNWGIAQQGTYAPADGLHRWMGSAAMDDRGNMALGYSISGTSTYPGIRYAGRLVFDAPGTLPQAEETLINGAGAQTHSANRWGDYSSLNVDPLDDCTFWYTQEYNATTSSASWHTRIGSFKFPSCRARAVRIRPTS